MKKNSKIYIWKWYRLKEKEKNEKYREDVKKIGNDFMINPYFLAVLEDVQIGLNSLKLWKKAIYDKTGL